MKLSPDNLASLIEERYLKRGHAYFEDDAVEIIDLGKDRVTGRVRGTHGYRAELRWEKGTLTGECSCPAFEDFGPCKHMAALGYAMIAEGGGKNGRTKTPQAPAPMQRIRAYLKTLPLEALRDLVLTQAGHDDNFRQGLELLAELTSPKPDMAAFQRLLRRIISIRDFIAYDKAGEYGRGLDSTVDALAALLRAGHAKETKALVEFAFDLLDVALQNIDDSWGATNDPIERLCGLHVAACEAAKTDPKKLTEFLAAQDSGWGFYENVESRYRKALGKEGLAHYKKLKANPISRHARA